MSHPGICYFCEEGETCGYKQLRNPENSSAVLKELRTPCYSVCPQARFPPCPESIDFSHLVRSAKGGQYDESDDQTGCLGQPLEETKVSYNQVQDVDVAANYDPVA
jgi:hypothetical protein